MAELSMAVRGTLQINNLRSGQTEVRLRVCVAAASLRDAKSSAAIEPWAACLELGRKLGFDTVLKA